MSDDWRRDVPVALRPIYDALVADDCWPRAAAAAIAYADALLDGRDRTQGAVAAQYGVSRDTVADLYPQVLDDVRDARRGPATKKAVDAWTIGGEPR